MSDYPVITVAPESVLESEQLGTKDKFWFNTDDGYLGKSQWLFKFPTEGTGQHWAEKIACEIAKQVRIDHASSLGRELRDSDSKNNRERYLRELGVAKYIERGRCPIFVAGTGKHGPSPFRLVQRCLEIEGLAPHFRHGVEKLSHLDEGAFEAILDRIPDGWMSPLAKEFTLSLLLESLRQLRDLP